MTEHVAAVHCLNEWTYHEDLMGIVYCLGRKLTDSTYEAVAVYERVLSGNGAKQSLEGEAFYNRLMYHGFPEEEEKLSSMRPEIKAGLIGHTSLRDRCISVDPAGMMTASKRYRSIEAWLAHNDKQTAPFRESLEIACGVMDGIGISLTGAELYGGAAFGLVGRPDKRVDDIDILLSVDSVELHECMRALNAPYKWSEIDPESILSDRRRLLKAKRWSTSQIRLFAPEFLSIDLKVKRDPGQLSLWDGLPINADAREFKGTLRVVDDSETYCISPAVRCEDEKGNERIVLFSGYPYIGCAVVGDIINIQGSAVEDSPFVLVTQAAKDSLVPDFSNVPIS